MAPFRWPLQRHDLLLATEVASRQPTKTSEYEEIASVLNVEFSTPEKPVSLSARACRERMDRLLEKFTSDDKKALKRSGTEEEYGELEQLLHDIRTYRQDKAELEKKEKDVKKKKEKEEKQKAEEMREAALVGIAKRKLDASESDSDTGDSEEDDFLSTACGKSANISNKKKGKQAKKPAKRRASKISAIEMLEQKSERRAKLKEQELQQRQRELEFERQKYEEEAAERKARLQIEMEERKAFLSVLKDKL